MPHSHRPLTGGLLVVALVGGLLGVNGSTAGAADTSPPALSAGWLETLNWYRTASGMKTVSLDSTLAKSIESHLKYLIKTDKVLRGGAYSSPHAENPASPFYTTEGESAGKASNIITEGSADENEAGAIDGWMAAPFHAVGNLREGLKSTALSTLKSESGRTYWGLNVVAGLNLTAVRTKNILFPGDGSKVRLSRFEGESPDPREGCAGDFKSYNGLPIFASLLKDPTKDVSVDLFDPKGNAIPDDALCVQTQYTFKSTDAVMGPGALKSFSGDNLVIIIPRDPLVQGQYKVKIKQGGLADINWSFSVAPAPIEGIVQGIPEQKVPVRRTLKWSLGSGVADYALTSQRVRVWSCPENKCTTNENLVDRIFPASQTSLDVMQFKDGFYFTCIEPINASGVGKCTYQIIRVQNSCDTTTCFVGSNWAGPESRCWQTSGTGVLEELRGKSWVKVTQVSGTKGSCTNAKYPYSYVTKLPVKSTGTKTYRWRILSTPKVLGLTLPSSEVQFLPMVGA